MDPQLDEPDLRSYLGTISRRKWLVGTIALLSFGAAVAFSFLAQPRYELRLHVQTRAPMGIEGTTNQAVLDRTAENELAFLGSTALASEVDRAYNGPLELSDISGVDATDLGTAENRVSNSVRLSLVTSDPDEGRDMLRIYGQTYVNMVAAEEEATLQEDLNVVVEQIADIDDQLAELEGPLDDLRDQITASEDPAQRAHLQDELTAAQAGAEPSLNQLRGDRALLDSSMRDSWRDSQLSHLGAARVYGFVSGGNTPVSPNIPQNLAVGLVFGLILGVAAAFVREYFDDSVKSKDAVERVAGVPAMGLIPKLAADEDELVAASAPGSPVTEAFRSLRTSVKFTAVDRDVRVIQVTSASAGEGKTVTAANLATVLAQAGDRVVLVSADLRRPRVEELFGAPLTPGVTEVLLGDVTLPQAVQTVDGVPNLSVLSCGQPPTNPSELLSGERARRLVEVLSQTYDIVVLDCPPLLPVTDSLVLARLADVTLLVTSARLTSRRELERAVELLTQMDANFAGCVITSLDPEAAYSSGPYGYDTVVPQAVVAAVPRAVMASSGPPAPAPASADVWPAVPEGMPVSQQPQQPQTPQPQQLQPQAPATPPPGVAQYSGWPPERPEADGNSH